ncbi:MAG TPA: ribosome maturation factor RimM [Acidimicrobiales bacterium]|nr:ribosome maturation factor RimM [Acidimicrobiales bacterium]
MLEVGRIIKPHGLRGDVIVALSTNRSERLAAGSVLNDGQLTVTRAAPHQHRWIVTFEGVDTLDAAEALRGTLLLAEPLADADALWVHELIGATVIDATGVARGVVESVQANPASDLLVLDTGPLVPLRFVVEQRDGEVVVDVPEGLFDT